MGKERANVDDAIAGIATGQHGIATVAQLHGCGLSARAISGRVSGGRLHRVYRGVYAVGHAALGNEGRWLAAVLACGEGAVLSHRSAAEHLGLLAVRPGPIHVTVSGNSGRKKRPGLLIHRSSLLPRSATTLHNGIAVTTPERTIADLRRTAPAGVVRQALRQANFKGLDLGNSGGAVRDRSELEKRFLRFCRRQRIRAPEVNVPIGVYTVDFLWRGRHLIVETDGWEGHRGRQAFEDDRERDAYLRLRGYEVLRFTWRQLVNNPGFVAAVLRRYLD